MSDPPYGLTVAYPAYTPEVSEVAWLRSRVQYLEEQLARLTTSDGRIGNTLPEAPPVIEIHPAVMDAIHKRADKGSPLERQMAKQAQQMLSSPDADADEIAKMLLEGEPVQV